MYINPLFSGSSGNCTLIGADGGLFMVDAGKSARAVSAALALAGERIEDIAAIFITHEHTDHIAGVGVLCRRYGIPVYANAATWQAMEPLIGEVPPKCIRVFESGRDFFIGGVSVLVAAIGIMNTMMMSIYERTKEIGIIKVLGCRMSNIAGLFLTEAAYIGFFGGALGLGLSYGLSLVLNNFLEASGFKSVIPLYLAAGALVFSIMVALISGLYPAMRAMKLSPLAAIRNE